MVKSFFLLLRKFGYTDEKYKKNPAHMEKCVMDFGCLTAV